MSLQEKIRVLYHEFGHIIHNTDPELIEQWNDRFTGLGIELKEETDEYGIIRYRFTSLKDEDLKLFPTPYSEKNMNEHIAEIFSIWMAEPNLFEGEKEEEKERQKWADLLQNSIDRIKAKQSESKNNQQ